MRARDLIGRKFKVVNVEQDGLHLTLFLEELVSYKQHTLRLSEEGGPKNDHNVPNWTEARFDDLVIFKT